MAAAAAATAEVGEGANEEAAMPEEKSVACMKRRSSNARSTLPPPATPLRTLVFFIPFCY
eukprot:2441325-Pleurochrysis_carterae.AAC.5